jgi:hypothetical protein
LTITLSVADEWPVRQKQKAAPNLGPTLPETTPRPLTIRRPTATYLCPDPRDLGRNCHVVLPSQSYVRLGSGASNALLRESWLIPPQMPPLDYNQTPAIFVYHVKSALDQTGTGFDAKVPAFIFVRGRASPPVLLLYPPPAFSRR